jgi:hypothetical protein
MEVKTKKGATEIPSDRKPEVFRKRLEGKDDRVVLDITETDADPSAVDMLRQGLRERRHIAETETHLKAMKKETNGILEQALDILGVSAVKDQFLGGAAWVETNRTSLDKKSLQESLLRKGVPADLIRESIEEATKTTSSSYVRYTAPKKPSR